MKENRFECDQMMLSLMRDGELGANDMALAEAHVRDCELCRKILADHQSVADTFATGLQDAYSHVNERKLDQEIMDRVRKSKTPWWAGVFDWIPARHLLIPATAVAAVVVISISMFTFRPAAMNGPSAIIDSFSGDVTSVVFLETPETRQTIIWYTEPEPPLVGEG